MNHYVHERLALAQRIAAFLTIKPKTPVSNGNAIVLRVENGKERAAAVAKYMAEQASALRWAWDSAAARAINNPLRAGEVSMYQAGAASAEAMSQLLLAAVSNDQQGFKEAFTAFINDAVDSGVVAA